MSSFEYTAIPAPLRADKVKGAKSPSERFAATLSDTINQMAREGWEYLRAETLPSEERSGLTGRTTIFHNLLIFRRATGAALIAQESHPAEIAPPQPVAAAPAATPASAPVTEPAASVAVTPAPAQPAAVGGATAASPVFSETMRMAEKPKAD